MLDLFKSVYNRQPYNSDEYVEWCTFIENNSKSINSRKDLLDLIDLKNETELNSFENQSIEQ